MTNGELATQLAHLTELVGRIAAPIPAIPAIAPIPAIPPIVQYTEDHNLLIKLDVKVDALTLAVTALTSKEDTHVTRSDFLERTGASDKIHSDFETRIRALEQSITRVLTWGSAALIFVTIAQFALNYFSK